MNKILQSRNQREGRFVGRAGTHAVRSHAISVVSGMGARVIRKLRTGKRRLPWMKPIPRYVEGRMHAIGARLVER